MTTVAQSQGGIAETLNGLREADGVALARYREVVFATVAGNAPAPEEVQQVLHETNRTSEQFEADVKLANNRVDAAAGLVEAGNMGAEISTAERDESTAKAKHEKAAQKAQAALGLLHAAHACHRDLSDRRRDLLSESRRLLVTTADPSIDEQQRTLQAERQTLVRKRGEHQEAVDNAALWRRQFNTWGRSDCPLGSRYPSGVKYPVWHAQAGQIGEPSGLGPDATQRAESRIAALESEVPANEARVVELQSDIDDIDRRLSALEASRLDPSQLRLGE